ncbi:MAG TPA: carbohydrate ABC transporter permease, partial [Caldilineaceae bacterium]|nr:carbohydrate ABC transporter permease [Caldilineaceae bacterium]
MNVDLRRGPTSGKLERVAVWLRRYDVLPHAALVVVMFIVLLPILWLISSSLKDAQQFYNHPAELLPRAISLVNYQYMFTAIQALPVYMTNSFILAFGVTAIQVLCASLAGYAFARMTFRGRDVIFLIIVISMFVPRGGGLMALYELMNFLKLRNSLFGMILLFGSHLPVPIFIMRQAFLSIPREIEESAM